jgi:hypothetical protein
MPWPIGGCRAKTKMLLWRQWWAPNSSGGNHSEVRIFFLRMPVRLRCWLYLLTNINPLTTKRRLFYSKT